MNLEMTIKTAQEALNLVKEVTRGLAESRNREAVVIFAAYLKDFADGVFESVFEPEERETAISIIEEARR